MKNIFNRKRLLFLMLFLGVVCSTWAQTEENLFDWQGENTIIAKDKFLKLRANWSVDNIALDTYKEYDVFTENNDLYSVKIRGAKNEEIPEYDGSIVFDFFEIYHNENRILRHLPSDLLYDVRYITVEKSKDGFIKVPLSDDSFALFFGGWLFGSGDTATEMVVVVVSGDKAQVVFDDYAFAYKYTPGENFAIEFIDDINRLEYENDEVVFPDSYLKTRTKHKIWKEGNMLKYKSWK